MENSPTIEQVRDYLLKVQPLGIGSSGSVEIKDIDPNPWSGHFNFLVSDGSKQAALRLKGPEWGEHSQGIIDEYQNLQAVKDFKVAPQPLWLDENTIFNEPLLLEEYLKGIIYSDLSSSDQRNMWSDIVDVIIRINSVPIEGLSLPFRHEMNNYMSHTEVWDKRLRVIALRETCREWHKKIVEIIPSLKVLVKQFQLRLEKVLKDRGPVFIFESAHAGHCIITPSGPRFLNWENVSKGDPSYTLAIFLASHIERPYFQDMKQELINLYLKKKPIPEFKELVEQRLVEREISNMIWVVWAYVKRDDKKPIEKATGVKARYERMLKILE